MRTGSEASRTGRPDSAGRWSRGLLSAVLAFAVAFAAACTPDDQRTESLDVEGPSTRAQLSPEVVEALDAGSEAFRADDYESALEHYTRAAELAPGASILHPTPEDTVP